MDIHNTMEDVVLQYLNEILEAKKDVCKCEQCITDMACYALNKVGPNYVISSRGVIHTENDKRVKIQDEIDVYATVAQAIDIVSRTRRHEVHDKYMDFDHEITKQEPRYYSESGSFFNFPQIVGRIFDSENIKLLEDVKVTLFHDTSKFIVSMFNDRWYNPIEVIDKMEGTYTFWPSPIPAEKPGIQKEFYLNMEVIKKGYDILRKFFTVKLISSGSLKKFIKKENILYIDDIFLNRENIDKQ